MSNRICSIEDCDDPIKARGWCTRHYTRWYETGSTELGVRKPRGSWAPVESRPLAERFWPKVDASGDCWEWTAGATTLGYGMIWNEPGKTPRRLMAHRAAWELLVGPIPEDLEIDHLCRNPPCVNPDHLEPVTQSENTRRGLAPSKGRRFNKAKTHCPQGHPYSPENTYRYGTARVCRTCTIERTQRRRLKEKQG